VPKLADQVARVGAAELPARLVAQIDDTGEQLGWGGVAARLEVLAPLRLPGGFFRYGCKVFCPVPDDSLVPVPVPAAAALDLGEQLGRLILGVEEHLDTGTLVVTHPSDATTARRR
jgi:hypothetical protein